MTKLTRSKPRAALKQIWDSAGMAVICAAIFGLCALFVPNFATANNMGGLATAVVTVGMLSCTMLFCLSSGHFDLSVGSVVACAGVLTAVVINASGSVTLGIVAGLTLGALVGYVNGIIIAKLKINALITTLATMQIVRGLGYIVSDGKAVGISKESFFGLGNWSLDSAGLAGWIKRLAGDPNSHSAYEFVRRSFMQDPMGKAGDFLSSLPRFIFLDLPQGFCVFVHKLGSPAWLMIFAFLIFGWMIQKTVFGRNTLALGGNEEAVRLAGINVDRLKIGIFAMQGAMAGFAGIVLASRMTSGQPMTSQGLELEVISACVLGGVSLTGGVGNMVAVVSGVLIMGAMQNAMNLLNVPAFWQYVARGAILLAAVLFDRLKQKR